MEAVGAASAILAFLGFTAKAISRIYDIYGTYKDASETVLRTTRDLRHLMRILEQILEIVHDTETGQDHEDGAARTGHARLLEDLMARDDGPMAACRIEIASILKIFESLPRIAWPLRKKDIEKHLENLERLKTQIGLAIQSQSMFVN